MHLPSLFDSFFLGGFECSTHRRDDGRRLDLVDSTGHARWAGQDYAALRRHGIRSARDGLRWHLIESTADHYDWSSFLPQLRAAEQAGVQVIWDLCHYGWPDGIDIWRPEFVERFARFAAAAARVIREESDRVPFYSLLNEMSFWAWAGGEVAYFSPLGRGRGDELKQQLVRASIAAIEAIRAVDPRARFVQVDPVIHVVPRVNRADAQADAERYRLAQFQAWDMLAGLQWPGLGGRPEYLDIVGVNFYPNNQWFAGGGTLWRGEPGYRPFSGILAEVYQRYRRPLLVAETGAEGEQRAEWLRYVGDQVRLALQRGLPLEGICLYPVLDYPGWTDDRHCQTGLFGYANGQGERPVYAPLAEELRHQQAQFDALAGQLAAQV
ncbi:beta-glucosidase [Phytopseudomonas seleniipraecipitans]|uniref:Beta-glucosidase/6-phospho-beta-glucosidase/beta-galactosidase n=1 Tax=Phytopseudomonas seleniipraecipitans TaxID=640205 RepID=A0A1G7R219_9GAMM|nr:beta-glucosidase [Pseudomonas seleniipraecipitans]SDG04000.1 Beta-glucosidase/6-phospho-beta-glucosidase/beta-galactosidase [Pseudomonas seleniipraecipitans]